MRLQRHLWWKKLSDPANTRSVLISALEMLASKTCFSASQKAYQLSCLTILHANRKGMTCHEKIQYYG